MQSYTLRYELMLFVEFIASSVLLLGWKEPVYLVVPLVMLIVYFFSLGSVNISGFLKCATVCVNNWRRAHDTLAYLLCSPFHMHLAVFNKVCADCQSSGALLLQNHWRKQGRENGKNMSNSGVLEHVCVLIGKASVFCIMWPTENQFKNGEENTYSSVRYNF